MFPGQGADQVGISRSNLNHFYSQQNIHVNRFGGGGGPTNVETSNNSIDMQGIDEGGFDGKFFHSILKYS
jgi:hypothetical protein